MKKVSVIIPLFNRSSLIKETLGSLTTELHPNTQLEIIVVDDGSTDGGDLLIEKHYPNVILLRQKNAGAPTARNKGLFEATGDYILFLDSDDLIEPNFFTEKVSILENKSDLAAVYGPWEHFKVDKDGQKVILPRHTAYPIEENANYEYHLKRLLGGWYIVCHALLWRRERLIEINGFDTSLPVNQDVDLLFKALVKKNSIKGVSSPKALYRDHNDEHRIGNAFNNENKLITILNLRKKFTKILEQENLLNNPNRESLSQFCFNSWVTYRKSNSQVAEDFYKLSIDLYPQLKIKGGKTYELLAKLFGARHATIIKSMLSKY